MKYDLQQFPTAPPNPGKVVILLGKSKTGPINIPIYIRSLAQAEAIFGSKSEGDLVRAYEHASLNDGITIYLMRVTGEYARGALLGFVDNQEQPVLKLRSIYGGDDYNFVTYQIREVANEDGTKEQALVIELPNGVNAAYPVGEFEYLHELVTAINVDSRKGKNSVMATTEFAHATTQSLLGLNTEARMLIGGSDGLHVTKDELYVALNRSYQILEGFEVDIVCPVTARFNDTYPAYFYGNNKSTYGSAFYGNYVQGDYLGLVDTDNENRPVTFHEQLITFCRLQQQSGIMTHGIIGLREVKDVSVFTRYESSYIVSLLDTTGFYTRYGLVDMIYGRIIDRGHYISIVGSDLVFNQGTDEEYYANGCSVYAGMVAAMPPGETTTNRPLPEGLGLRHEFTAKENRELAVMGVTVIRNSVRKGLVVANGVTASLLDSELHFISNVRIVQHALNAVNAAVDDLIGEPFSQTVIGKEIHRRLDNVISGLKYQGVIKDARFKLHFSRATATGEIKLDLLPKHAIEFIATDAMLQFNGRTGGA